MSAWAPRVRRLRERVPQRPQPTVEGVITRMVGLTLEAAGCEAPIGARCGVMVSDGEVETEVVGFSGDRLYLMPTSDLQGLTPNARVRPSRNHYRVPVGDALLGRVVDGNGQPLDDHGGLLTTESRDLIGRPINPLQRKPIREPLDVGIRAINALLTVGRGQRLGLFAGSGVGKSVLLGMMTRYTRADVVVVGLIGERGREVKEFVEDILGADGLRRAVVIAAPADTSPLMRLHGAMTANSIAEYFRDQGKDVLLLMDSLTRYAQAQREISLAIGEPPATKGYPPSVFANLPRLVERAGNGAHKGSITAFYTVLVEGDDHNDPIADSARAILDGHFVLSRELAESGHYPAIDLEASVSRAMPAVTDEMQRAHAQRYRQLLSTYRQNRDLISVGAYQHGSDAAIDEAIAVLPALQRFARQPMHQAVNLETSLKQLRDLPLGSVDLGTGATQTAVAQQ